jgi:hypothetical protein
MGRVRLIGLSCGTAAVPCMVILDGTPTAQHVTGHM